MIAAGREAGEIAANNDGGIRAADAATLTDLGVERNLAADAVRFARLDEDR
ncbi:MAG TPA: hypothetical protein VNS09_02355 [Solirubrobacter sp.]|nr:hypothetical protein [Solirubrobacter sp.]